MRFGWVLFGVVGLFLGPVFAAIPLSIDPPGVAELDAYVVIEGSLQPAVGTKEVHLEWLTFRDFADSTLEQRVSENEVSVFVGSRRVDTVVASAALDPIFSHDNAIQSVRVPYEGTEKITYSSRVRVQTRTVFPRSIPYGSVADFRNPSLLVASDDFEIRGLASSIPSGTSDLESLLLVNKFVHDSLKYEGAFIGSPQSALDTWRAKKASCNGYANLAAAILRAKGFPVRVIVGLANDRSQWREHAWIEVFTREGWISMDPTYDEVLADATHIVLARGIDFTAISDKIGFVEGKPVQLFRAFQVQPQAVSRFTSDPPVRVRPAIEPLDATRAHAVLELENATDRWVGVDLAFRSTPGVDASRSHDSIVLMPLASRVVEFPLSKKNPGGWLDDTLFVESPLFSPVGFKVRNAVNVIAPFQTVVKNENDHAHVVVSPDSRTASPLIVRAEQNGEVFFFREFKPPLDSSVELEIHLVRPTLEPVRLSIENEGISSEHWLYPVTKPRAIDPWQDAWNGLWSLFSGWFSN